jgi:carbon starvation protein
VALPLLALGFLALLALGYRLYGGFVARRLAPDDARATPAVTREDGRDFVPTRSFYLFGQHFSAIAAAGPIAGPILACQSFGWLPCLLWIGFGVIFIGAVHDFAALHGSVRHGAGSIAEMAREHLGAGAGRALMAFIWLALVYVILAFADITAGSFVSGSEELQGGGTSFNPGGAVAAASVAYLALSLLMGVVQRFLKPPLWLLTLIFVPATFALAWAGTLVSHALVMDARSWALLILGYCGLASVAPMWLLLQPRGYLGGFVLYAALAAGLLGVLFGGYAIEQPAFKTWDTGASTGALFPFLFVTIACGACSGFHGLVCSGTTSKQIARESHCRPVGYGAMLGEAFVALIALVTVMIVAQPELAGKAPGRIYGEGIGRFLTILLGPEHLGFAITFGAMAFSTFVFDTLDVTTRLGRYLVQELTGWKGPAGAAVGTILTLTPPALILGLGPSGSYQLFWALFGASNQLLAALTLTVLTVWLARRHGVRGAWFTLAPALFLFAITLWALASLLMTSLRGATGFGLPTWNALAAGLLIALAVVVGAAGWRRLRRSGPGGANSC